MLIDFVINYRSVDRLIYCILCKSLCFGCVFVLYVWWYVCLIFWCGGVSEVGCIVWLCMMGEVWLYGLYSILGIIWFFI